MSDEAIVWTITPEWRNRVTQELDRRPRGAYGKLAEHIGCSSSTLSQLLDRGTTSTLVPAINAALGWDPPTVALPGSSEMGTIRYLVDRADERQRSYLQAAANMLLRAPDAAATQALRAMLDAFRVSFDPLRDLAAVAKILVVEGDAKHLRQIERSAAGNDKIDLVMTDNAIDGMLLVGVMKPTMVLIDVELGGIDACRRIKANPSTAKADVVLVASSVSRKLANDADDAGAWRTVKRPVDLVQLLGELVSS